MYLFIGKARACLHPAIPRYIMIPTAYILRTYSPCPLHDRPWVRLGIRQGEGEDSSERITDTYVPFLKSRRAFQHLKLSTSGRQVIKDGSRSLRLSLPESDYRWKRLHTYSNRHPKEAQPECRDGSWRVVDGDSPCLAVGTYR